VGGLDLRLSEFGPAFGWLLQRGVSSTRLASLFGTTAVNVRVIAHRARHGGVEAPEEFALNDVPSSDLVQSLGARPGPDDVVRTPSGARRLAALRNDMEETVWRYSTNYEFQAGVKALRRLAPQIGYPGDSRRIALSAQLHQHMAWFLVHGGSCYSATLEASIARDLWRIAYNESSPRSRAYAECFIKSALIGSHAYLLIRRPEKAWHSLAVATQAAESIGARLGSDHFRQRGVALFQLREDERAALQFQKAAEAMEELHEAQTPAELLMTGVRHTSLLGKVNWDQAQLVLLTARRSFGQASLEASMALHWAAACGLSTDSQEIIQSTQDSLLSGPDPVAQFGHQSTIRRLLRLTPELGLDDRLRRAWVRRALYENAFRNR